MAHKLDSTAVTPQGATFPLYRVNTDVCDYNAYTDDTGCSCIIYTDTFDDVNTICQTSSAQTAYYWTDRTNCIVKTIKGESVDRMDKGRSVDSMTGSQYCSGVFDSNAQVLESVLSMPVGPDVNLAASTPSSSSSSASRAASSSSSVASSSDSSSSGDSSSNSPSGSWTTTSFTGPCECQQYLCYTTGGCDEAIPYTFSGADSCTAGSTSVSKSDGTDYRCFVTLPNSKETLFCQCRPVTNNGISSTSSQGSTQGQSASGAGGASVVSGSAAVVSSIPSRATQSTSTTGGSSVSTGPSTTAIPSGLTSRANRSQGRSAGYLMVALLGVSLVML
ncbi:hypothetical protein D6C86_03188 [Aureobasidium pullulans]|uniref:Uncharacterized protein n=1 Tax=Aureobasidium pullulans TaxID=5580 RepID=A0A4S9YWK4_AURPU|nr:hypothetical protein D6C94_03398 [Aureobasidium pullulans]THZ45008.1 hypothetical protein D6C87_03175 [Aureobasidium pullulans]THZ63449.1 hypothetical protein D6C86_03188 [Aureobasidium pullulans]THZ97932.1 hypothetical protein D6C88_01068 [Aureobasidium pullulans]